jgi:hypothetical protein
MQEKVMELDVKTMSTDGLEKLRRTMEARLESIKENPLEEGNYQTQRSDWQNEYKAICEELEKRHENDKL